MSTEELVSTALDIANLVVQFAGAFATIIFGLFALAGYTVAKTVFDYKRKLKKDIESVNSKIKNLQTLKNVTYNNIIAAADIALIRLPEMTYTQQIPVQAVEIMQIIDNSILAENGENLWGQIENLDYSARIQFARGLYYMAQNADNKDKMRTLIPPKKESVIELFENAQYKSTKTQDDALDRLICLRLSQAHRQLENFDAAKKVLDPLANKYDVSAKWALAIIDLQQGFAADNKQIRTDFFNKAKIRLETLYGEIFGWKTTELSKFSTSIERDNSIAYYTAKSMWSWYFSQGE